MNIILRPFQKDDIPALESIIRKTWKYDELCSPKTAALLAKVFLSSCLTNYTFSQVAVLGNRPVGILLGNYKPEHHCPFVCRFRQATALIQLYLHKEGRKTMKIFQSVSGMDKKLLEETHKTYPAELALFAVDPVCRGKGVGKQLFQKFLCYMQKKKADSFYLYTDTSCNYGFYEHQGMTRRGEQRKTFLIEGQKADMCFFLYDFQMTEDAVKTPAI